MSATVLLGNQEQESQEPQGRKALQEMTISLAVTGNLVNQAVVLALSRVVTDSLVSQAVVLA